MQGFLDSRFHLSFRAGVNHKLCRRVHFTSYLNNFGDNLVISFNLPESTKVMEHIIEKFEKYQDVQGVAENINELFEGIQNQYFSY
jgi:hypothetical protein